MAVRIKYKEEKKEEVQWLVYHMMMVDGVFQTRLVSEDGRYEQIINAGQAPIIRELKRV